MIVEQREKLQPGVQEDVPRRIRDGKSNQVMKDSLKYSNSQRQRKHNNRQKIGKANAPVAKKEQSKDPKKVCWNIELFPQQVD